jgi:hypothetical protein
MWSQEDWWGDDINSGERRIKSFQGQVMEEEAKNSQEWWKAHEVQFLYVGFVAWHILRIVGS